MSPMPRTLSDQLVDVVRDRILSGSVADDRPIRQDALAGELGVSKIPLREALAKLEQEGLLRSRANHGFFVRSLTAEEAEEVYALRLKLEPEAAAQAAERATPEEQRTAREALAELERLMKAQSGVGAANRAFHLALIRPSARPLTINFLERLHVLSERYVGKHLEPIGRERRANEEHRALVEAWLGRKGEAVAALMTAHISQTLEDLHKQLC